LNHEALTGEALPLAQVGTDRWARRQPGSVNLCQGAAPRGIARPLEAMVPLLQGLYLPLPPPLPRETPMTGSHLGEPVLNSANVASMSSGLGVGGGRGSISGEGVG